MRELYSNSFDRSSNILAGPQADTDFLAANVNVPAGLDFAAADMNCGPVLTEAAPWNALTVKHQHERTVEMALAGKGFEAFSPMYRTRRQWSDRTKEIELPLFAGYVFCRFPLEARARVLNTPAIWRVVEFGGRPAPVGDAEIEAIRAVLVSKLPMRPWPHLKPGDRVRIERGPLRGVAGVLLKEKDGLKLIVSVELLQRSVAVQLDAAAVVPMGIVPITMAPIAGVSIPKFA